MRTLFGVGVLLFVGMVMGILLLPKSQLEPTSSAKSASTFHYQLGCTIYDEDFKEVWSFPSRRCWFNEDGSFMTGDSGEKAKLQIFDKELNVLVSKPIPVHHQINKIRGNYYFLSEEFVETVSVKKETDEKVQKERQDILVVMSPEGEVLRKRNLTQATWKYNQHIPVEYNENEPYPERSHFNSIFEIPDNPMQQKMMALKPGNIVVNDNRSKRAYFFDSDLKELFFDFEFDFFGVHSVSVTGRGELLFFYNQHKRGASDIRLIDLLTLKETVLFDGLEGEKFFQPTRGWVLQLDDSRILFTYQSDQRKALIEYNWLEEKVERIIDISHLYKGDDHVPFLRKADLSGFLKHNQGL